MIRYYLLLLIFGVSFNPLMAAGRHTPVIAGSSGPVSFTSDITILANPVINVPTVADYRSGVTITHSTLKISGTADLLYTLQVRASGNFMSGANSIPTSQIGITTLTTGLITQGERRLSTAYQSLCTYLPSTLNPTLVVNFQYKLYSDSVLLKPAGSYTTTLTFLLTLL